MQKAVEIESRGLTLRGMLHIPEGISGKVPMVPIFHGFTGNKMEPHFIFVKLSRMLEKRGIASVRFDFGGSGESDGDFVDMTISKELEDAKNILDYVKTLNFIDVNRIGIVGLSMGGAVASMLAGDCRDDIKSLCLWAPAGNMGDLVMDTVEKENMENVRKSGYYDLGGLLLGTDFIDDIISVDIYEKAAAFDKNVLLLHGDKDMTVPLNASERYLEKYESKAVLHVIEGADHTFNRKNWEDEVIEYTLGFFEGEFR
ncbi:MAG: alpha/beta fold hydrolase [Bacillota bacterium]|nr:alpha/beta fold hydrolase [Bacillota bacterium]